MAVTNDRMLESYSYPLNHNSYRAFYIARQEEENRVKHLLEQIKEINK
jgi:hypothetical protein